MKAFILLLFATLSLNIAAFALPQRVIEAVSIQESEGCSDGVLTLSDGSVWGWSPFTEDENRVLGWEKGDEVFIAPFAGEEGLYITLFNLSRELPPKEEEREGQIYYIQPEVAPIVIWPKRESFENGSFMDINEVVEDAGWIYTDLYFALSNGRCVRVDSGQVKGEWEVGDKVFFSRLGESSRLLLINMSKEDSVADLEEATIPEEN